MKTKFRFGGRDCLAPRTFVYITILEVGWAVIACDSGSTAADAVLDSTMDFSDVDQFDQTITDAGAGDVTNNTNAHCPLEYGPENRVRRVVVSHPYDEEGTHATAYEVLLLDETGTMSRPGTTFEMGRGFWGEIAFSNDGNLGFATQEDGTIGVFMFEDDGAVTVVNPAFEAGSYANKVIADPNGYRLWGLNSQWREHGGGLYDILIGCDGTISAPGISAEAKLPAGLVFMPESPNRGVLAVADFLDSTEGTNAHLVDFLDAPTLVASVSAWGDNEAIIGGGTITRDGMFALFGDINEYSKVSMRVAVVMVTEQTLEQIQVLKDINDPIALLMSPYNNAVAVVSGYGNAVYVLEYDQELYSPPFVNKGEVTYVGAVPRLPSGGVLIERGDLSGMILIGEISGVRQMRFMQDGTVDDIGLFNLGDGMENMVGLIGVQP